MSKYMTTSISGPFGLRNASPFGLAFVLDGRTGEPTRHFMYIDMGIKLTILIRHVDI